MQKSEKMEFTKQENALDYVNDLAKRMFNDLPQTFFYEVANDAMRHFGIFKGAVLIVKREQHLPIGQLVVCEYFGEHLVRKVCLKNDKLYLCINNTWEGCTPIIDPDFKCLGVVDWVCKQVIDK